MKINSCSIINFRNLASVQLNFNNSINILYGQNGSGKTSLLEAMYYLATGSSFRSHHARRIIALGTDEFQLFCNLVTQDSSVIPVGISRNVKGQEKMRVNGEAVVRRVQLARLVPVQLINSDSYQLVEAGPIIRRQYLDWGLFHVEQGFYSVWQDMQRVLKQRNSLLKQQNSDDMRYWDIKLTQIANTLHLFRQEYVNKLLPILDDLLCMLIPGVNIKVDYIAGWNISKDFLNLLQRCLARDIYLGYTSIGPHRADLLLTLNGLPANDSLSRGQQKMLVTALKLAQGLLLKRQSGKSCVYMIDDLPSELDSANRGSIINFLHNIEAQVFLTGVFKDDLVGYFGGSSRTSWFHVKQGAVMQE